MEVVTISGYQDVPENDEESLLKALAHQPLSVAIEASGRDFQFYKGVSLVWLSLLLCLMSCLSRKFLISVFLAQGVFNGRCGTELDHGVAAVGYGPDYIIVKNSWGAHWGEKGYIRMKRSTGKSEGICGINKMASFPTKKN